MERRGVASPTGDYNRHVEQYNAMLKEQAALEAATKTEVERISSPPRTREDAMERVREDAVLIQQGTKAHVWTPGTPSPDGLTWWQRAALHIAVKARSLAQVVSEKAKSLWQRREADRSRERERYKDRGIDR